MQQLIKRKDNITYIREVKEPNNYNQNINIRIDKETLDIFKGVAKQKGIAYSELLRDLIRDYAKEYSMKGE